MYAMTSFRFDGHQITKNHSFLTKWQSYLFPIASSMIQDDTQPNRGESKTTE